MQPPPQAPPPSAALLERLAGARLVALDVDGCLTDGRIVHGPHGEQLAFDVKDGQGLVYLARAGLAVAWISGRDSPGVRSRAQQLGVRELHLGVGSKEEVLRALQARTGLGEAQTVAMGDDLPDLGLRAASALFVAPADACAEVRRAADHVTAAGGGRGAVRELCELVLAARGLWPAIALPRER